MIIANKSGVGVYNKRTHSAAPALNHFLWIQFARPAVLIPLEVRCSFLFYYDVRAPRFSIPLAQIIVTAAIGPFFLCIDWLLSREQHFTQLLRAESTASVLCTFTLSRSAPAVVCKTRAWWMALQGCWTDDLTCTLAGLLLFLAHFAVPMAIPVRCFWFFNYTIDNWTIDMVS